MPSMKAVLQSENWTQFRFMLERAIFLRLSITRPEDINFTFLETNVSIKDLYTLTVTFILIKNNKKKMPD